MIIKEHQIQYSSFCYFLLFTLLFLGCRDQSAKTVGTQQEGLIEVLSDSLKLIPEKGLVYYQGQPFSGISIDYYNHGIRANQIEYLNGKKHGYYRKWFPSGVLSFESAYKNGKKHGQTRSWWKNKNLRSESNFVDGIASGPQWQWYKSGAKFKRINLVNGKEEGIQQSWRENGKLYNNYEAKNGRIFGLKRSSLCFELKDENIQYGD